MLTSLLTFRYVGTPTLEEFYGITSRRSRDYIRALPIRKKRPFTAMFPDASPEAIDFLLKTLVRFLCVLTTNRILIMRCLDI